jgi:hypothetical protein
MNNLCTVSDINYLHQGLALYDSLRKTSKEFTLHYLCLDTETYNIISKLDSDIQAHHIRDLLAKDDELVNIKNGNYSYFCWLLASYFSNVLLPKYADITYIDSDIYFHRDIQLIFDEIGTRDVGIFRHRQFPLDSPRPEGYYNVGVVHFKNTPAGRGTLSWWADAVLNKRYPDLSTCGDQKYLDHFPNICETLYVDENIGHGAPWQWQVYELLDGNRLVWEGQTQDLVFTHFSSFRLTKSSYIPSVQHRGFTPASEYTTNKNLKAIYDEYYSQIKLSINFYMS